MNKQAIKKYVRSVSVSAKKAGNGKTQTKLASKEASPTKLELVNENLQKILKAIAEKNPRRRAALWKAVCKDWTANILYSCEGPKLIPLCGNACGRTDVCHKVIQNFSVLKDQKPILKLALQNDCAVILELEESGIYVPTEKPYQLHAVQIFEFEGDLISRMSLCFDTFTFISNVALD